MAVPLKEWIENEAKPLESKGLRFLSEQYFHRVEVRSKFHDNSIFFSPADGIITAAHENIKANESIINVKGKHFSLQDLVQDEELEGEFLVIGIFMTFYSQHQNYIPYSGRRTWSYLDSISTFNKPMLETEKALFKGIINPEFLKQEDWLYENAREVNEVFAPFLNQEYLMVRIADYDVSSFVNWGHTDGGSSQFFLQGDRFGMITYGSYTALIIPQYNNGIKFKLRKEAEVGNYVKCLEDGLVNIVWE